MQNHCCAPSMYTKVVEVEGESRLVFFARTDIKPGQELTYDYRCSCLLQICLVLQNYAPSRKSFQCNM